MSHLENGRAAAARRVSRAGAGAVATLAVLALTLIAGAPTPAAAQPRGGIERVAAPGVDGPPVARFVLPNGLRVVVVEDRRAPAVEVAAYYAVGAADDPIGRSGLAELMRSIAVSESALPGAAEAIAAIGGRASSETGYDYTVYRSAGPAARLALLLRIEAARMGAIDVDDERFARARAAALALSDEARRDGVDVGEAQFAALFDNHPYRRPISGWPHELAAIDPTDVQELYGRAYAPDTALLVIAGDVSAEIVLEAVTEAFGALSVGGWAPEQRLSEPTALFGLERRVVVRDPRAAGPILTRSSRLDPAAIDDPAEQAAFLLLAELLSDGERGALARALAQEPRSAFGAIAEYEGGLRDHAVFVVTAAPVDEAAVEAVELRIVQALSDLAADGPSASELAVARSALARDLALARSRRGDLARLIGEGLMAGLSLERVLAMPATLDAATAVDVAAAARAVLAAPSVVGVALPGGEEPSAFEAADALGADEADPSIRRILSDGGVSAWLVEDRSAPILAVTLSFETGSAFDDEEALGAAGVLAELMGLGAGSRDADAFAEAAAELGADFAFEVGPDAFTISMTTLAENRDAAFALLRDALTRPRFDRAAIQEARARRVDALAQLLTDPAAVARVNWLRAAFGDDAYGRLAAGLDDRFRSVGAQDLREAARVQLNLARLRVVAVGPIDADDLGELLDATLRGLPAEPLAEPSEAAAAARGGVVVARSRSADRVTLAFGHLAPEPDGADRGAVMLLAHIMAGDAYDSRLARELRVRRGLATDVSLDYEPLSRAPIFLGFAELRTEDVDAAVAIIEDEWARMAAEGPTSAELEAARAYLVGALALEIEDNADLAQRLAMAQRAGLSPSEADDLIALLNAVDLADIRRVAQDALAADELLTLAYGPAGALSGLSRSDGVALRRPADRDRASVFDPTARDGFSDVDLAGGAGPVDDIDEPDDQGPVGAFIERLLRRDEAGDRAFEVVIADDDQDSGGFGDPSASLDDDDFRDAVTPLDEGGFGDPTASLDGDDFRDAVTPLDDGGFGDPTASLDEDDFRDAVTPLDDGGFGDPTASLDEDDFRDAVTPLGDGGFGDPTASLDEDDFRDAVTPLDDGDFGDPTASLDEDDFRDAVTPLDDGFGDPTAALDDEDFRDAVTPMDDAFGDPTASLDEDDFRDAVTPLDDGDFGDPSASLDDEGFRDAVTPLGDDDVAAEQARLRAQALVDVLVCSEAADASQDLEADPLTSRALADAAEACGAAIDSAVLTDREASEAHRDLGVLETAAGDLESALEAFDAAVALDPRYAEALVGRGQVRRRLGRPDLAEADFDAAIAAEPDFALAYFNRGRVRRETGDLDGAIEDQTTALRLDPRNIRIFLERGISLGMQSDFAAALEDFRAAVRLEPDNWQASQNRGYAAYRAGEFAEAVEAFTDVIDLRPDGPNAYDLRADAFEALGDDAAAAEDRAEAQRLRASAPR